MSEDTKEYPRSVEVTPVSEILDEIEYQANALVENFCKPTHVVLGCRHILSLHVESGMKDAVPTQIVTRQHGTLQVLVSQKPIWIEVLDGTSESLLINAHRFMDFAEKAAS